MKRRFSLAIVALCAMIGFSSLHAADPDPYQNLVKKDGYTAFKPTGNFSMQARLATGQTLEARNADGKGFSYKAEKPGVYSFLADIAGGTLKVYWGPELEAELQITTSEGYISLGGDDWVNAEIQDPNTKRGIYNARNLFKNPGFETVTLYDTHTTPADQRGKADGWSVLPAFDIATSCRAVEVSGNSAWEGLRPYIEGSWIFMLHNVATPMWQELSTLKASTWYKVHYRHHSHKDTSPATAYTSYIASDSAILAAENENLVASFDYTSAPQGFENSVDVIYGFKTPATLPSKLFFAIKRTGAGCIANMDRMTLQELSESNVFRYGVVSSVDSITWEDGLEPPRGGAVEIYEDVTDRYFVNPSFETDTVGVAAEGSLGPDVGNSGVWVPEGWTVAYSATRQAPEQWDQGLVTWGLSGFNHDANVNRRTDIGYRATDGTYLYYFRTRWMNNQDFTISQVLKDVPYGRYDIQVTAAADNANPATFRVSGAAVKSMTINDPAMKLYTMELNVMEPGDVTVSAYVERIVDSQARLALDDFRLIYRGAPIDSLIIDEYMKSVEAVKTELEKYDETLIPSGVIANWNNAMELEQTAIDANTVNSWKAASEMYSQVLEEVKESTPLYERLFDMFNNVSIEVNETGLSGGPEYIKAAEGTLKYLISNPANPLYYAADLEQGIEELLTARRAYYYTGFNDATTTVEREVTYALDYAPYFTKYGGDVSLTADRIQGSWKTNNNPATGSEYKLHTVNGYNCWNNWNNNFTSMDVYQELTGLPEGMYSASALTTTNGVPTDQHTYLTTMAGTIKSPAATYQYTGTGTFANEAEWEGPLTTDGRVYLPEGGTLRIGFASTGGNGTAGWFCVTGFRLFYSKATPADAEEALKIKIEEAEAMLDTASIKIMGVEKAALESAITTAKNATGEEVFTAFAPLNTAMDNANISIANYNAMYPVLVEVKVLLNADGYSQEAKEALSAVITAQEAILEAASTAAADIPAVTSALKQARIPYIASKIATEIPNDVSASKPYDLTHYIVNPTIEAVDNAVVPDGWTITRTDGDKNSVAGQHYSGDVENRYLDSYNSTGGKLKFTVLQDVIVPGGTYRLVAAVRSGGEGAYLYAHGHKPYVAEIENHGAEGGPIWNTAADGSDEKLANNGLGYGWSYQTVDEINVEGSGGYRGDYITIGVTCDPAVSGGKAWAGTWFSADDFKLYCISKNYYTGIEDVNVAGDALTVYSENGYIIVEGVDHFEVMTLSGARVSADSQLAPGFYIVTAAGKSAKVVVR